ncbi:hypothetical protein Tco_1169112, partial [Tanacetum coccineum]
DRMEGITIEEYLAMEERKMAKQSVNLSFDKLWYLADEDEEEERTHESLYPTLDEKYDVIACDISPELEFLLASESYTVVPVCYLETFKEKYEVNPEVFNLLGINVDLFTCDTPLWMIFDEFSRLSGMEDDLFTYEVDQEIMEGVVSTWLVRSYRKQFDEYMEIKRRLELPNSITIRQWIGTRRMQYGSIGKKGDDEEVFTYDELFDLEEEDLNEGNEIAEIDIDVLAGDLPGFKTYEDYKNAWIYEWNNEVLWDEEKPWLEDGIWKKPIDDICHEYKPFRIAPPSPKLSGDSFLAFLATT